MASIYKPTYTKPIPPGAEIVTRKEKRYARYRDGRGKLRTELLTKDGTKLLVEQKKWRIEYTDAQDKRRRVAGYTDRKATEQLASDLERQAAREQSGLIDQFAKHRKRPLSEHLKEWHQSLLDKGTTQKHADLARGRAQRVIEGCRFASWSDISPSNVQSYIAERRNGGLSVQTGNYYLRSVRQFCRWMVQDGRAPSNPLQHLKGGNVQTDRRHDRRAFTDDELRALLKKTWTGAKRYKMAGSERALLYRLAAETGLRAGEIRNLMPGSFDLEADPATVTVEAAFSKHRRKDELPVLPSLARELRVFLADHRADDPLFSLPSRYNVVRMLRADLADARSAWIKDAPNDEEREHREKSSFLTYRDEAGRVLDFHAFRHTFITNLARGGVHPKQAQDLARHSDINLTLSRYSHTVVADRAVALQALPDLTTRPEQERQKPTGTDGRDPDSGMCTSMCTTRMWVHMYTGRYRSHR